MDIALLGGSLFFWLALYDVWDDDKEEGNFGFLSLLGLVSLRPHRWKKEGLHGLDDRGTLGGLEYSSILRR